MKQVTTLFLKLAIVFIGIVVLALCIFLVPKIGNFAGELYPAIAYMKSLEDQFHGNRFYALAAYNWGPQNVQSWVGQEADPSKLPSETQNYVRNVLGGSSALIGAPVDQPRGGMQPDRRQMLIQSLMGTKAGAAIGQSLFSKELDKEANRVRPLTENEKGVYPGAVAIEASGKPVFPPPSTNVSLNASNVGESEYSKEKAKDAVTLERSADKTLQERQQLEVFKSLVRDFSTGKLAPAQSTMGAWGDAMGIDPVVGGGSFDRQPNDQRS